MCHFCPEYSGYVYGSVVYGGLMNICIHYVHVFQSPAFYRCQYEDEVDCGFVGRRELYMVGIEVDTWPHQVTPYWAAKYTSWYCTVESRVHIFTCTTYSMRGVWIVVVRNQSNQ